MDCREREEEKDCAVVAHIDCREGEAEKDKKDCAVVADIEEREGAGVDTLVKDRYDMELELAKTLMQQEFDDTLQAEKVGRCLCSLWWRPSRCWCPTR